MKITPMSLGVPRTTQSIENAGTGIDQSILPSMQKIKMHTKQSTTTIPVDLDEKTDDKPDSINEAVNALPATEEEKSTISDLDVKANGGSADSQPLSPQLAALAKERRALQIQKKELEEKEKALNGQTRADLESKLKSQPLRTLLELGVTYDQLTQDVLNSNSSVDHTQFEELKNEIKSLKKGFDEKMSATEEAMQTQAINYVADKLDSLVENGDEFEVLKLAEGQEEVIRRVYNHWRNTGRELDVAKVAREYQDELIEEAVRYAKLKQVQSKLIPEEPLQNQQKQVSGIRTLTNKDSARPVMDRKQRAIMAMQGQLKR